MANFVRTQVMLEPDLLADLRWIAEEKGWSVSEVVRRGTRSLIKRLKPKKKDAVEMLWKMAQNPIKGDVPSDLGSNDEYLYGKLSPDYKERE